MEYPIPEDLRLGLGDVAAVVSFGTGLSTGYKWGPVMIVGNS